MTDEEIEETTWEMDDELKVKSRSPVMKMDANLFWKSSWAWARLFDMFSQQKKFRAVMDYDPKLDKVVIKVTYSDE